MAGVSWLRALAASVVLTLGASLVSVTALVEPGFTAPADATVPVAEDPGPQAPADQVDAMRRAHLSKQRVEVASQRTETSQTFANPDGTLTLESTARPARVHRSDGSWAAVDTSLSRDANGAVVPQSTTAGLKFSNGGSGPLATVSVGGKSLSLTWPDALPPPTLSGSTAVYADVLPGVDLRLTAEVDGFGEVLVVKTREAATNPELTTLTMGIAGDGVTVSVNDAGQLSAVDGAGTIVFGAPTALMWDSSDPAESASNVAAHAAGPAAARQQSTVDTTLDAGGDTLTLVPDPAMLDDPDTVYPVFVDPDVSTEIYTWTYVDSQFPNQAYMSDKGRTDAPAGMYQATNGGYYMQRSYIRFKFKISTWGSDVRVTDAEFRVYSHYQWNASATDHPIHAYSTSAPDTSTTWNNQPTIYKDLGNRNVHAGEWAGFDATAAVQQAADNDWLHLAFRLSSGDEDNYQARETYSMSGTTQPTLAVTVDHKPNKPTGLKISPCYKACVSPAITSTVLPTYTVTVSDPDGGNLKNVKIEVWTKDGGTKVAWTYASLTNVTSGRSVAWKQVGAAADGQDYYWKASACDGDGWCSDWSSFFYFHTDAKNPFLPKISGDPYSPDTEAGGVGVAGTFTFTPGVDPEHPDQVDDVYQYYWSLNDPEPATPVTAAADNTATVSIVPKHDMGNTVYVQAIDTAGNRSDVTPYFFYVAPAPYDVAGTWPMDEGTGTTAVDQSQGHHDLTLHGGATWMPGHVGNGAVQLDGTDDYLSTDVSTIDTTKSFSVAAWVYLDDNTRYHTAVTQDGGTSSAFYLQYRSAPDGDCWAFGMRDADTPDGVTTVALSNDKAWLGEWTHLVGVYDDANHQLRLYVNGVLQTDIDGFSTPIAAASALNVGRGLHGGQIGWYWQGQLDEVRIYQRILTTEDIDILAHADDPLYAAGGTA
ncbi:LamG-like jellyroll fold domain-containing protein [Actinocatenispora rupis]|uniref:LamG-like jellyroll fold domain-containing protein n=1 Tax=Actinocatenispora rupis TaxID=519421 RepID=A0A8J3J4V9_9ACTN|nr:LamG-like jellyroll fold domain-containing protein [Actinocatenispora rupis]GID10182.1 hypothetical protein Aru02nite_10710 [Actinocatenispora rupis]